MVDYMTILSFVAGHSALPLMVSTFLITVLVGAALLAYAWYSGQFEPTPKPGVFSVADLGDSLNRYPTAKPAESAEKKPYVVDFQSLGR